MQNLTRHFKNCSHDETISYVLLPIERLNETLKVLEEGFYSREAVSICTEVAKNPKAITELNNLCTECIKDGISIVAIDHTTNQIVGVSINKIQKRNQNEVSFFEEFIKKCCKEKESIALINFMIQCDAEVDLFDYFKTNKLMEIMFLSVLPSHSNRGIGLHLVKADLQLLDELATSFYGPEIAIALFSGKGSQRIGEKLNFEVIATKSYSSFEYKGIKYSDILGSSVTHIKIVAKKRGDNIGCSR